MFEPAERSGHDDFIEGALVAVGGGDGDPRWLVVIIVAGDGFVGLDGNDLGGQLDFGVSVSVFGDTVEDALVGACKEKVLSKEEIFVSFGSLLGGTRVNPHPHRAFLQARRISNSASQWNRRYSLPMTDRPVRRALQAAQAHPFLSV